MTLSEDIDERAKQIEELFHFWSPTHRLCKEICANVDSFDAAKRKEYWKDLAKTNKSVSDLTELIDMCSRPDPCADLRGYY